MAVGWGKDLWLGLIGPVVAVAAFGAARACRPGYAWTARGTASSRW